MKTYKNTIENFASEAITISEMNFLRGGGALNYSDSPIDIIIPPKMLK